MQKFSSWIWAYLDESNCLDDNQTNQHILYKIDEIIWLYDL